MFNKLFIKMKRAYHRWCLRNCIAHYKMKICTYHASTNSYTVQSARTGFRYHVFVDARGKILFRGIQSYDE